ncbi:hypothetical protein C4564_01785, partial [Candidatus Microgenomates bacterium]
FLLAALWGYARRSLITVYKHAGAVLFVVGLVIGVGTLGFVYKSHALQETIALMEAGSSPASAHPEAINLVRSQEEFEALRSKILPSWLSEDEKNYRLYTSDAQVNVWWNSLFDIPLVKGYLDPVVDISKLGDVFLLDQSIAGDDIVRNFDYPEEAAYNMALYYADWYAVKYGEGGHLSKSANKGVSSYLKDTVAEETQTEIPGAYILYETESGKPEVHEDIPQYLNFYKFPDDLISPIMSVTNAPVVMCFCDWSMYESVTKALAMNGIDSKMLITLFSENAIDSYSLSELKQFEGLVLANYHYNNRNKAFTNLSQYVENGGSVFIDTGSEVKEAQAVNLPDFFPFAETTREGLGSEWDVTQADSEVFTNVDFSAFAPPTYNEYEWKFSYPTEIAEGEILLAQEGKPVLVAYDKGAGHVVWSGMNLAYHVYSNTNAYESILFVNLLDHLMPLTEHAFITGEASYPSPRIAEFTTSEGGKGVLFKKQLFNNWQVRVNGKTAKMYAAGPTYPGFMYVPLSRDEAVEAYFQYNGEPIAYAVWLFSISVFVILLDLSIFKHGFLTPRLMLVAVKIRKTVKSWWGKEE